MQRQLRLHCSFSFVAMTFLDYPMINPPLVFYRLYQVHVHAFIRTTAPFMFFNSSSFRNISKAYTLKGFYKIQKKNICMFTEVNVFWIQLSCRYCNMEVIVHYNYSILVERAWCAGQTNCLSPRSVSKQCWCYSIDLWVSRVSHHSTFCEVSDLPWPLVSQLFCTLSTSTLLSLNTWAVYSRPSLFTMPHSQLSAHPGLTALRNKSGRNSGEWIL